MNPFHSLARLARRARLFVARDAAEQSMDDEMRYHIECEARDRMARGQDEASAWRSARQTFGGLDRFKEEGRDARGTRLAEDLQMDARYAVRVLRRSPAFALASLITLALGIGATTAIFSVVRGVLLRPLPYAEPERLAVLWERNVPRNHDENVVSVPNFEAWRARSLAFDAMAGMVPAPLTLTGLGDAQRVRGAEVSSTFFTMLGARPLLGRVFASGEGERAPANVIVLSHRFWLEHFRGEQGVMGRAAILDGSPRTVIGVMPADFEPPRVGWMQDPEFWIPFTPTASNRSWGRFLIVIGRLGKGVSIDRARADQERISAALAVEDKADAQWSSSVKGLTEQIIGDVRTQLWVLMVAVGLLLAMAIANVANLTLAQLRRREHEIAVRGALGATRPRLIRQLLTQSALLGIAGGIAGVLAAFWGVHALIGLLPTDAPRAGSIRIDGAVLAVAALTSVVAVILFGAWPTLHGTKDRLAGALGESGHRGTSDRLGGGALIVAEVALAVGVSVIAGLAMRSFLSLRSVELGFDARDVVVMRIALPGQRYQTNAQQVAFFESLLGAARGLPGVQSAGTINIRPFGGGGPATTVAAEGKSDQDLSNAPVTDVRVADGDYFRTLRIALVAGRTFGAQDVAGAPARAVVSRSVARQLWPGEDAIGKRVKVNLNNGIVAEVIGVVADVRAMDARTAPRPAVYLAFGQSNWSVMDIVVRGDAGGAGGAAALVPAVRKRVAELDAALPVYQVAPMSELVSASTASERFTSILLASFALTSLVLAGVGIYGVLSGDVVRRRREIGIRLALGARPYRMLTLVLRRGLARAALGVALGLAGSLALTRSMRALLFEVSPADPVSFGLVALLLLAIAAIATLVPAVRASRVGPAVAMRGE